MKKKMLILIMGFLIIGINLSSAASIKVMTYNIEASGINPDWKQVVKEENPDIVVFVETGDWDDNSDQLLNQYLAEFNAYFVNENPYIGSTAQNILYNTSGEAIMSRFPIISTAQLAAVTLDDGSSWDPTHDFMVWQLDIDGNTVYVIGSHLKCCSGAANEDLRERAEEGIINYMDSLGDVSIIYAGDLNSFSPADTGALAPLGDLGYGPLTMIVDPADPTYGQYSSTIHSYTDVFRTLNPTTPGYTYGHQDPLYESRIDYIIVNQQLSGNLISSTTGDTATANTGSDHYSVDVIIDFASLGNPDISATPANRNFGIVAVGDVSPSQIFTISNNGTLDLVIGNVYLTGTNPFQFSLQKDTCAGVTLLPSDTCTMEAQYVPTKTGTMYAEIDVNSNDLDTPTLYIDLTGTGVDTTPPVSDPNVHTQALKDRQ